MVVPTIISLSYIHLFFSGLFGYGVSDLIICIEMYKSAIKHGFGIFAVKAV